MPYFFRVYWLIRISLSKVNFPHFVFYNRFFTLEGNIYSTNSGIASFEIPKESIKVFSGFSGNLPADNSILLMYSAKSSNVKVSVTFMFLTIYVRISCLSLKCYFSNTLTSTFRYRTCPESGLTVLIYIFLASFPGARY